MIVGPKPLLYLKQCVEYVGFFHMPILETEAGLATPGAISQLFMIGDHGGQFVGFDIECPQVQDQAFSRLEIFVAAKSKT